MKASTMTSTRLQQSTRERPLAIDLYCGLGGWTDGLLAAGYRVIGFDNERHEYGDERYPGQLVVQDVRTLHGSQFRDAVLIVASPPCTEYSYMAMPWGRAKQIASALRGEDEFPEGYKGSRTIDDLNDLFNQCFRIQREACDAAGRHVPMVVENVRGAQPWVGRAAWNYGSFYLWGDVPALMPQALSACKSSGFRFDGSGKSFQTECVRPADLYPSAGLNWSDRSKSGQDFTRIAGRQAEGRKQPGLSGKRDNGKGSRWFQDGAARSGSKSTARKAASAIIAKIPEPLSRHIARTYYPVHPTAEAAQ